MTDILDQIFAEDNRRIAKQHLRIFELMRDGEWRTLDDISMRTGDPAASVSAQLRHLRKERFGAHTVERKHLGHGLYEYRLLVRAAEAAE